MDQKVILITGASSGLGKTTASYLARKGHKVIGTSRTAPSIDEIDLSQQPSYPLLVNMDITDPTTIQNTVSFLHHHFNRIDVLINNAGYGISGPIEETSISDAQSLFNTNFFGTLRVIQDVLPLMRKQQSGLIINISSIGGILGLPFQGVYSASKFAVEGMTEALRMEVSSFGINVVLVEPGDFHTGFTDHRKKILNSSSLYAEAEKKTTRIFEHDEQNGADPIQLASLIERIIRSTHPKCRYRVGSLSQRFAGSLKGVISDRIVQWILMKYYKLK
jgi:short-subunit dehydrogenase